MRSCLLPTKLFRFVCSNRAKKLLSLSFSSASSPLSSASSSLQINYDRINELSSCRSDRPIIRIALDYLAEGHQNDIEEALLLSKAFRQLIHLKSAVMLDHMFEQNLMGKKVLTQLYIRFLSFIDTHSSRSEEEKREIATLAHGTLKGLFAVGGQHKFQFEVENEQLKQLNAHNIRQDDVTFQEYSASLVELTVSLLSLYQGSLRDDIDLFQLAGYIVRVIKTLPLKQAKVEEFTRILETLDKRLNRLQIIPKHPQRIDHQAGIVTGLATNLRRFFAAKRSTAENACLAKVAISLFYYSLLTFNRLLRRCVRYETDLSFERLYEITEALLPFNDYVANSGNKFNVNHIEHQISNFFEIYADFLRRLPQPVLSPAQFRAFVTLLPEFIHIDANIGPILPKNFVTALVSFLQANLAALCTQDSARSNESLRAPEFSSIIFAISKLAQLYDIPRRIESFFAEGFHRAFLMFLVEQRSRKQQGHTATAQEAISDFQSYFGVLKGLAELESTDRFISSSNHEQKAVFSTLIEALINGIEELYEPAMKYSSRPVSTLSNLLWSAARLRQHNKQEFMHRIAQDITAALANLSSNPQTRSDMKKFRPAKALWAISKLNMLEPALLELLCEIVLQRGGEVTSDSGVCYQLLVIGAKIGPAAAPPSLDKLLLRDLPLISKEEVLRSLDAVSLNQFHQLLTRDFLEIYQGNDRVAELLKDLAVLVEKLVPSHAKNNQSSAL
jgi:hypothetical protein